MKLEMKLRESHNLMREHGPENESVPNWMYRASHDGGGQRNSSFPIMNANEDDILEEDEEEAELVEQP